MLTPLKMKCPSCREEMPPPPPPRCPHCRADLHKLDLKFGVAPKHFGPLSDRTLTLSRQERRKLQTLLKLFRRKFPQSTFAVLLADLPVGTSVGEYAFWLANRARFGAIESLGENNFDLLLVVDVAGAAALTVGYGLEKLVPEEDLSAALEAGRNAFAGKNWSMGVELCVTHMMNRLREITRATNPK
ncbi:MAG: TPM domain-containing protein [Chthoniobacterales bacterium]